MKKSIIILAALAFATISLFNTSCTHEGICKRANGAIEADSLTLASFTSIDLREDADVFISQGPTQSVVIKAESDVLNVQNLRVQGGELIIDVDGCFYQMNMEVFITVPATQALENIVVSGSGSVYTNDSMAIASDFRVSVSGSGLVDFVAAKPAANATAKVSGSGDAKLYVDATNMETNISGSGKIFLYGEGETLESGISGSGDLKAFEYYSTNAEIRVSGSGDAEVYVDGGILDGRISGSGSIKYKGQPGSVNTSISGSGDLIDAN